MELEDNVEFVIKGPANPVGVIERVVVVGGTGDVQLQMKAGAVDDGAAEWVPADDAMTAPTAGTFFAEPGIVYRWSVPGTALVWVGDHGYELVE